MTGDAGAGEREEPAEGAGGDLSSGPGSWLETVQFAVYGDSPESTFDVAKDVFGPAGGFIMSREEMTDKLERLKRLRQSIDDYAGDFKKRWSLQSPAKDPASLRNTAACYSSRDYYVGHMARESGYLTTIIEKMEQALGIIQSTDEQAAEDIGRQGEEGPI